MYQIPNCGKLEPAHPFAHEDLDARGLIKIFEDPDPSGLYSLGVDVSNGLTNWCRDFRTDADIRTDNCAVEVVRKGMEGEPDVQAAEFAAPIEPEDLSPLVNFLGRLYCGRDESGMAPVIIEIHPGPGMRTQRDLWSRFHYYNLYIQKSADKMVEKPTGKYGWLATKQSVRDLWGKASRHIKRQAILLNSKWLVEEMANVSMHPDLMWGEAVGRKHDDRVRALMLAIWQLHAWDMDIDFGEQRSVQPTKRIPWAATDMSAEEMMEEWDEMYYSLAEED